MVNKESPADFGSGVDFNASEETTDMGEEPSQKPEPVSPEKISPAMIPQGMQPRIAEDDLRQTSSRRVFSENCPDILSPILKHASLFIFRFSSSKVN